MRTLSVLALALCLPVGATELGIRGDRFTVDGEPAFLLGASYYGGCSAPAEFVTADFRDLREAGFNWVRVWATWPYFDPDTSVFDPDGRERPPYLQRLVDLVRTADSLGLIVDVTVTPPRPILVFHPEVREVPEAYAAYERGILLTARALKPYRNVYLDLGNECYIRDGRFVSTAQLTRLAAAVREVDPDRLLTASPTPQTKREVEKLLVDAGLDFLSPHLGRDPRAPAETPAKTHQLRGFLGELGLDAPIHYQEPLRRGFMDWDPEADAFLLDLRNAVAAGAAGWCLHNGGTKASEDLRPFRCFVMTEAEGRLMDQLDAEELRVVREAAETVRTASAARKRPRPVRLVPKPE
jgi:hypothetical protein